MIKMLKGILISIGLVLVLTACEKEVFIEPQRFASLTFANYSKDIKEENNSVYVTSDGLPAFRKSDISSDGIYSMGDLMLVPEGKRRLSFFTKKGGSLFLDTVYNAEANKKTEWAYLQPPGSKKPFLIENKYYLEAKQHAGYVKVRSANFTENIFKNPVDVVFYTQGKIGGMMPTDTLKNLPTKLDKYVLLKKGTAFDPSTGLNGVTTFNLVLIDSKTKKPLHRGMMDIRSNEDKNFFTFFIREEFGVIIIGTKKKVALKTLFIN
jgi:hypothetical protein